MHETPTIQATPRERVGSRYAKRLRQTGQLPAIIYGHQVDPIAVSVDHKELLRHLQHGVHLFNLKIEGQGTETCLVKDLQFGYLGDNVIHVDLARVNLSDEVEVNVSLRFMGEAPGAREAGAIVNHDLTELTVACRADAIPEEIVVDEGELMETLTVADLTLPEGVRAVDEPDSVVAHISIVAEMPDAEAADVEGAAGPEVIGESDEDTE